MRRYHCDPNNRPDYCSLEGAQALKAKIEAAWKARGLTPRFQIVASHSGDVTRLRYDIRSDMVGGWPRGAEQS